jgi:alkaline phosphatase
MTQRYWRRSSLLRVFVTVTLALAALVASVGPAGAVPPQQSVTPVVKNVIVMIADGSGYNHNIAASLYRYGAPDAQPWERFPYKFAVSTYSANGHGYDPILAWSDFNYVKTGFTDSAAAATAMACGVKTYDAGIGVDAEGNRVENVVEKAEKLGMATGVVTSVAFSHATPAGFVAHNKDRNDYKGIAAEMIEQSGTDVIMGGGHPWYDSNGAKRSAAKYKYLSQATWESLVAGTAGADANGDGQADPWTLVENIAQFRALESGPTPNRVMGVAPVYFTVQEERYLTPTNEYPSPPDWSPAYTVPFLPAMPTLAQMTRGALNVLDNDPDGFFLMVEGGAVDYAAHYWRPGRIIEERIAFDDAILAVINWVSRNSNWRETVLIVTSDHETGLLCGPGSDPVCNPLVNNGRGQMPGMELYSSETIEYNADGSLYDRYLNHTNALVPLWARGEGGRYLWLKADQMDPVRGRYLDNTELALAIFEMLAARTP